MNEGIKREEHLSRYRLSGRRVEGGGKRGTGEQ